MSDSFNIIAQSLTKPKNWSKDYDRGIRLPAQMNDIGFPSLPELNTDKQFDKFFHHEKANRFAHWLRKAKEVPKK
jgi:hypothetical protein